MGAGALAVCFLTLHALESDSLLPMVGVFALSLAVGLLPIGDLLRRQRLAPA